MVTSVAAFAAIITVVAFILAGWFVHKNHGLIPPYFIGGVLTAIALFVAIINLAQPSPVCPLETPEVGTHRAKIAGQSNGLVQLLVSVDEGDSNTECYLVHKNSFLEDVEYSEKLQKVEVVKSNGSRVLSVK